MRDAHLLHLTTVWLTAPSDLRQMRSTLAELGFDVPKQDYGLGNDVQEDAEISAENRDGTFHDPVRGMSAENG